ncbi:MAG: catalase-related domain-containing protein, partial [Iodobacter sp.]
SFSAKEKTDLVNVLGAELAGTDSESKMLLLSYFYKADADYGTRLSNIAQGNLKQVKAMADKLTD